MEFWFEFASTYSYVAAGRIETLARVAGVEVAWRPFLLGPIFQKQGWSDSPFNLYPAKGAYMWRDMERLCQGYGLPFKRPSVFPRNGVRAARVALLGAEAAWGPGFVRAVYRANFGDDRDIGDPEVLVALVDEQGVDGREVLAEAESPERRPRLREQTERAEQLGIFGAPTFVVGSELFWGSDRLEQALELAARQ
jgi:2-hydroxychromene-2-carboxylate isomerase